MAALGMLMLCGGQAHAQLSSDDPPPHVQFIDEMGVDLRSGQLVRSGGSIQIGAADTPALAYSYFGTSTSANTGTPIGGAVYDERFCVVPSSMPGSYCGAAVTVYWIKLGERVMFSRDGGPTEEGAVLSGNTLTELDGTVWTFVNVAANVNYRFGLRNAYMSRLLQSVKYPSGEVLTFYYDTTRRARA